MYKSDNLGLNITDMAQDGNQYFNFETDLAQNYLAIDKLTLSQRHITNCITKIPQNIKLELANGALTLKKGSKLYKPNGASNFQEIILNADVTRSNFDDSSNTIVLFYNATTNIIGWYTLNQNIYSGDTAPASPITQSVWYDTLNNVIKNTADAGRNWIETDLTLPFAIVTRTNGVITSIDQVFNGFGYIGSTYFSLPGVECLIPNGRKKDGSLINIEHAINEVQHYTITEEFIDENTPIVIMPTHIGYFKSRTTFYFGKKPSNPSHHTRWYDAENNYWWEYSAEKGWIIGFYCVIGGINIENTKINSFTYKNTFNAVDFNDYQGKITELETRIAALETALAALKA